MADSAYNFNLTALNAHVQEHDLMLQNSLDTLWKLLATFLVFFMQAGFGMLEAGVVGEKNQANLLVKNIVDASVAGVGFWLVGYGFAYGEDAGGFIGTSKFATSDNAEYADFVFQWAFSAAAATIVAGAVCERCNLTGYILYTTWITMLVYPVVVHWTWGGGWLTQEGFHDFAGSGVVHMTGGVAAFIGAIAIGPRLDRFEPRGSSKIFKKVKEGYPPSSLNLASLGTFILWFGWYGFNCGSVLAMYGREAADSASLVAINTTLSPTAAVLTQAFLAVLTHLFCMLTSGSNKDGDDKVKKVEYVLRLEDLLVAALGGLVGVTAGCDQVTPAGAIGIGIVSSIVATLSKELMHLLGIDDPCDACPVHFFCGMWGVAAVGIFGGKAGGAQFGKQLLGVVAIFGWVAVTSALVFFPLKFLGVLRVSRDVEEAGLDYIKHGKSPSVARSLKQLTDYVNATSPRTDGKKAAAVSGATVVPKMDLETGADSKVEPSTASA